MHSDDTRNKTITVELKIHEVNNLYRLILYWEKESETLRYVCQSLDENNGYKPFKYLDDLKEKLSNSLTKSVL